MNPTKEQIKSLRYKGLSLNKIGDKFGVTGSTVWRILYPIRNRDYQRAYQRKPEYKEKRKEEYLKSLSPFIIKERIKRLEDKLNKLNNK